MQPRDESKNGNSPRAAVGLSSHATASFFPSSLAVPPASSISLSSPRAAHLTSPSSPGTPASPTGLTRLRTLPFPNRLLKALPAYLSSSSPAVPPPTVHRWLRLPYNILTKMTPEPAYADPLVSAASASEADSSSGDSIPVSVGDADKAVSENEQTLLDRLQQEKMRQEVAAALASSEDLASGQSNLLGKGEAASSHRVGFSTPLLRTERRSGGRSMSVSLPSNSEALYTLQHAALSSVLAAHQSSSKHRVSFSALAQKLPLPSLKQLRQRRRSRSLSHSQAPSLTSPGSTRSSRLASSSTPSSSSASPSSRHRRHRWYIPRPHHVLLRLRNRVLHICRELIFLLHLAAVLISQLGLFGRWAWMACRLLMFAAVLTMAWIRIGCCVFLDRRIQHSIQYGPFNRNFLDIYLPTRQTGSVLKPVRSGYDAEADVASRLHPVFIYVTGGAWIIGYKAWGALLGLLMRRHGCLVVSVDYRNFPQGGIEDMIVDVEQALRWIYDNIDEYGGDRRRMFLAGQSAGAHITSVLLMRNAKREAEGMFELELKEDEEDEEEQRVLMTQRMVEEAQEIVEVAREQIRQEELEADEAEKQRSDSTQRPEEEMKEVKPPHSDKHRPPPLAAAAAASSDVASISVISPSSSSPSPSPVASPTALLAVSSALRTGFPVSRFLGYIGISGIYELSRRVIDHLHASGLPGGTVVAIMGGAEHLHAVSPIRLVAQPEYAAPAVVARLPPTLLIHGSGDRSVPLTVASQYGQALAAAGVDVRFRCYIGATHTDPIIEHPMRGCYHLTNDLHSFITEQCAAHDDARAAAAADRSDGRADDSSDRQQQPAAAAVAAAGKRMPRMLRMPSLEFEVNGEQMVNSLAVRLGRRLNPF